MNSHHNHIVPIFQPSTCEQAVFNNAVDFCRHEVAPRCESWELEETIPHDIFAKAGAIGLLGLTASRDFGGQALSHATYTIILQHLAQCHASFALNVAVHNTLVIGHILMAGTVEQKREFLPPLIRGDWLGAWALTEPKAGSDCGSLATIASETRDCWKLTGHKTFITGGRRADLFIVMANSAQVLNGKPEISTFIVRRADVLALSHIPTHGMRASDTAEIQLDHARGELLGERGHGLAQALALLDRGRIGVAALAIGIARAAINAARRYAMGRVQFGKPIAQFQAIQWMLADSAMELDAAELLTRRAAAMQDQGMVTTKESAMAKLFASETATRVCGRSMQIHGGNGYTRACSIERHLRDVKLCEIAEGTSEIQRLVIARHVLRETDVEHTAAALPILLREATLADVEQIAQLFEHAYTESSHPCKHSDYLKTTFTTGNESWFVAAQGEQVLACTASIRQPWNCSYQTCRSVTNPEFRGNGLGTRLYRKSLEVTCRRRDCELTIGFPRTLAMYRLMSQDVQPSLVLVGHDGGLNIANGKREYHLIGLTGNGHHPIQRIVPPQSAFATAQFIQEEILSRLEVQNQDGIYPRTCFTGPLTVQETTLEGITFRYDYQPQMPNKAFQITGLATKHPAIEKLRNALVVLLRQFVAAEHVSACILVDKEYLIQEMRVLGFEITAYLPAWHMEADRRYDAVLMVKRNFTTEPEMHQTQGIIARFNDNYARLGK